MLLIPVFFLLIMQFDCLQSKKYIFTEYSTTIIYTFNNMPFRRQKNPKH